MEIIKIGGSVLSNIDDLKEIAKNIAVFYKNSNNIPIIVISAFKNHTDDLINMTKEFCEIPSSFVITTGEQITAGLLAMALEKNGIKAQAFAGWQVPIFVDDNHNVELCKKKITKVINSGIMPVITGFQGINKDYEIKDLGRGGSDLTAVILAKEFNAVCVLMKKSGGICSADPELIKDCFIWDSLGYDNLLQLAQSGSKVLQKEAIVIAKEYSVPIKISSLTCKRNTYISANISNNFWSLFSYNKKLRIVSSKHNEKLKNFGFTFNKNLYYECTEFNDIANYANKVYAMCCEYYK